MFKYVSYLSWFRNAVESMIVNEMHSLLIEDPDIKVKVPADFVLDRFGFKSVAYAEDIAVLWATTFVFYTLSSLWLRYKVNK